MDSLPSGLNITKATAQYLQSTNSVTIRIPSLIDRLKSILSLDLIKYSYSIRTRYAIYKYCVEDFLVSLIVGM